MRILDVIDFLEDKTRSPYDDDIVEISNGDLKLILEAVERLQEDYVDLETRSLNTIQNLQDRINKSCRNAINDFDDIDDFPAWD